MLRTATATATFVFAILVAACTSGPSIETETTTTTIPVAESVPPTTQVTLPPAEDVVRGTVDGVIDGNTLQAVVDGQQIDVRLIGINAPGGTECYGDRARTALASLVTGKTVVLTPDGPDTDAEGRALRYVIVEQDPPVLVNAELVSAGAAVPLHSDHSKEADFLARGDHAYASGKGMWGTFVCGHPDGGVSPDRPQLRINEINLAPTDGTVDLSEEWFQITNQSYTGVSMSGWTVRDELGDQRLDLSAGLGAGKSLRVISACGSNGSEAVYWCADSPIWSTAGNTIILQDGLGNVVDRRPFDVDS